MLKVKRVLTLLCILMLLAGCHWKEPLTVDTKSINVLDDISEELNGDIHSAEYMVIDMSDFHILYKKDADRQMYPASLTKLVTLDTMLHLCEDLNDLSYVSDSQVRWLISEDASLAYIQRDYPYTFRDLLYALVLPSGADAAFALWNYCEQRNLDLIEEMNRLCEDLGCTGSHFVNSTGLHDDDHYATLDDLFLVVMDILKNEEGRKILETLHYTLEDGTIVYTTLGVAFRNHEFRVLGGKTGYTPEAGQNIIALCKDRGKSYLVMTANAYGSYYLNQYWHYDDVETVFEHLR